MVKTKSIINELISTSTGRTGTQTKNERKKQKKGINDDLYRYRYILVVSRMSWCFVLSQSANRIDELYYKGMRLRRDAAARKGTKSGARGAQEEGKKKDTPAPLWAGAYTRRVGSERRQTG
jgi:hypothetical protein